MSESLSAEYVDYVMCTRLYHCTPSELAEQPAATIDLHWRMYQAELKHAQSKRK